MNENGTKRREWVKNAAIVFLVVMLLLTFFSQTIMNYSLPEVATQYVQSGTITAKIRGSGVVESGDPYEVKVTETRKVASVAVRKGDTVQKGDVLYYLEGKESDELKAAMEKLDAAREAYEKAMLSTDLTSSDITAAENGVDIESYRSQITAKQNAIKAAENAVKAAENDVKAQENAVAEIQERYNAFTTQINIETNSDVDLSEEENAVNEARDELQWAQDEKKRVEDEVNPLLDRLQGEWEEICRKIDAAIEEAGGNTEAQTVKDLINERTEKDKEFVEPRARLENVNRQVEERTGQLKEAEQRYQDKKANGKTNIINNLKRQQSYVQAELDDAKNVLAQKQNVVKDRQETLTDRQDELKELEAQIGRVSGLQKFQDDIDKAQEEVDRINEEAVGSTITAPISGIVTELNVIAGNNTSASVPVAVMQPEGKGYTLSFSVTNEQAKRLSVGDRADLVNSWRYGDVVVTLASIKPDKNDPGQKKQLTFDVTGSCVAGQSLSLSVGQKSANYDLIVPNSAIREDNNGKFILKVDSKQSPLGTRYTATRVDVEVLASDDTQSAISGALYGHEFVITTSTKPVEAGKLIRLADN